MFNDVRLLNDETDFAEFLTQLKRPWKTMDSDMDTALTIITNHAKSEFELEPIPLLTFSAEQDEIKLSFPSWQAEVEKTFVNQYGLIAGKLIFNKVLMRLFQMSRGSETALH